MGVCGNKIGWECYGTHKEWTKLAYCSPFCDIVSFKYVHSPLFSSPNFLYTNCQPDTKPDENSHRGEILNHEEISQTWERKMVKEGTLKGGAEKFRARGIEQTATFHHQNSNKQLFRKKKCPEPCRFVSEGEKPAVRWNRPLIFLSCRKGNHTLGKIHRWTSSSYIHCLSYALCQCIHTPPWNKSQNTLGFSPPIAFGNKTLLLLFYCVCACQKSYSILFLWQGFRGFHNPEKWQPVVQQNAT